MTRGGGIRLNPVSLIVYCPADTPWRSLEAWLRERRTTLGWTPPLSPLETLGELLDQATDGLRSSLYGDVRSNCVALNAVLADGTRVETLDVPRSAAGPDWKHLLFGGQGHAGRIQAVSLRAYPVPQASQTFSCRFEAARPAVSAVSDAIHRGALPAAGFLLPDGSGYRLEVLFEGRASLTSARAAMTRRICAQHGGRMLDAPPAVSWPALLGDVPEPHDDLTRLLATPDLRVTSTWRRLPDLLAVLRTQPVPDCVVTGFRHVSATIRISVRGLEDADRHALPARLTRLGGVLPRRDRQPGPLQSAMAVTGSAPTIEPASQGGDRG